MEPLRTFIAIELPGSVKSILSRLQDDLRRGECAPVKWVNPDGIHLTLKFLGNVGAEKIPELTMTLRGAATGIAPFRLELGTPGVFPHFRAPRVIWIGLIGNTRSLSDLQQSVERALGPLGFPPEGRRFSAHLTLGRVRESATPAERQSLGEAVSSLETKARTVFEVNSVSLMRSTLSREGASYSCLASIALAGR